MMQSKVVMVTGATGVIGTAICHKLAELQLHVIAVGRSKEKCENLVEEIKRKTNNSNVEYNVVDLSSFVSIKEFAENYKKSGKKLNVLINNAAIVPHSKQLSPDGLELQFAVNVMSYHWMIREFAEILKNSAPARVVNVASNYAGDLDLKDLQFETRQYDKNTVYRQSKQANRMLSAAHAALLTKDLISVNACHPGVVNSGVLGGLGFNGWQTADDGAETPVLVATGEDGGKVTGQFFNSKKHAADKFTSNTEDVEALYQYCEAVTLRLENKKMEL